MIIQGTRTGVPLTYVYPWYLLCSLGILGDYNLIITHKYPRDIGLIVDFLLPQESFDPPVEAFEPVLAEVFLGPQNSYFSGVGILRLVGETPFWMIISLRV